VDIGLDLGEEHQRLDVAIDRIVTRITQLGSHSAAMPSGAHRIPEADDTDRVIVVVCRQGYSSSLAAASLQSIGLRNATDLIGGFEAWVAAGLPVTREPADVRR